MTSVIVNLQGDGAAQDLAERGLKQIHLGNDAEPIRFTYLSKGMQSGWPSVAMIIELPDRTTYVLAEMSMKNFLMAATAFRARAEMDGFTI